MKASIDAHSPARGSILEDTALDYSSLGLARNPFDSVPTCSDLQPLPKNSYLNFYLGRLSSAVRRAPASRSACIYLIGPSGSGKSTILRALCQRGNLKKRILPIYVRFPLIGGRKALYNELMRRLPTHALEQLFQYAKKNYSKVTQTYFGRKLFWASVYDDLWISRELLKISTQYSVESIAEILQRTSNLVNNARIALILDEFEHAWARFTGAQKYNWEKTVADLFLQLGSKIILVFPVVPERVHLGSRPYLNMHDWREVDLDRILKVTLRNSVEINCSQATIKNCICSILDSAILDKRGKQVCKTLLGNFRKYSSIGEAITDLRGQIFALACKKRELDGRIEA